MQVTVHRVPRPNVAAPIEVPVGACVLDVLRRVGAPPDAVIVLRDGTPLPLDATVEANDQLRVVNVFSGG
jgi:sulfur carrier protein ThiS